jgi:hypothetical protein
MMKKTSLWLMAATAAGFALGFAGCGETMPMPTTCTADSQCAASEACHPVLRRCVTACTAAVDCPDSAKTCATFGGLMAGNDAGVKAFCQCATDALCERGSAGQVCQPATKICGAKCTASSECPSGSTCDTMTGKCSAATTTDGGASDGGMTGDAGVNDCTPGSCTAPQICDPTTRRCAAPATCTAANPQPDTCAYGLACVTAACAEAPRTTAAACANFTNVPTPLAWNPATIATKGAVTTAFAPRATNDTTACAAPNPNAFTYTVDLYSAPMTNFPAMLDMAPSGSFNYVRTDGQIINLTTGSIRPMSGYAMGLTNNNKNLRLVWTGCTESSIMSLRAGFYAANGNANCATANQ